MAQKVVRQDRNGLAWLKLNRPERLNSLTLEVFEDLLAHVEALSNQTDEIGCVILSGEGSCFSAGLDMTTLGARADAPQPNFQSYVIQRLAELPLPLITAVHGHCYTGGLELALAGDVILASANARFADTHAKWALTPTWGMTQRLPRRVGRAMAFEMMLTCQVYDGAAAEAIGLANRCFPDHAFSAEVEAFAREILTNSWYSHRVAKGLLIATDGMTTRDGLAYEAGNSGRAGPDVAARIAAFRAGK